MKTTKAILLGALLSAAASLCAASVQAGEALDAIMKDKMLVVGSNSDYRPNAFMGDDNQLQGFDIDVSKEVAKRLGVDVKFVTPGWEVMTAGRWSGRWHMVVGSMTPTKARAEVLDFPAVYYYTPAAFAVHKNSKATSLEELNGKTIGVVGSSTYHKYLQHNLEINAVGVPEFEYKVKPGEIKLYGDINEFDELALGDGVRLDALVQSVTVIQEAIKKGLPIKQLGDPIFYEPLAIAIDKGDKEFADKLASIVEDMKKDGTLAKLSVKWHGADLVTTK
ncbi:MAG TPA: amino acid ABC transporter substrate-binding protein [Rhizobiales bacterium]|nr:amino acid ABC transporter substrate-binding protein [Hyphomicrobiales bacterium]